MNKWIAAAFLTILACHLGNALQCYTCAFGTCTFPSNTTCEPLQVCLTEKIQTGKAYMKRKSCSTSEKCMQGSETTYLNIKVTTTPSCCMTDLCNSAAVPAASVLTSIAVFISLWVARL